jgi:hypothetical protein
MRVARHLRRTVHPIYLPTYLLTHSLACLLTSQVIFVVQFIQAPPAINAEDEESGPPPPWGSTVHTGHPSPLRMRALFPRTALLLTLSLALCVLQVGVRPCRLRWHRIFRRLRAADARRDRRDYKVGGLARISAHRVPTVGDARRFATGDRTRDLSTRVRADATVLTSRVRSSFRADDDARAASCCDSVTLSGGCGAGATADGVVAGAACQRATPQRPPPQACYNCSAHLRRDALGVAPHPERWRRSRSAHPTGLWARRGVAARAAPSVVSRSPAPRGAPHLEVRGARRSRPPQMLLAPCGRGRVRVRVVDCAPRSG